jgi:hypothetical protein
MTEPAGSTTRPDGVIAPEDEQELLAPWVLGILEGLRRDFSAGYGLGVHGLDFAAWRLADRSDLVIARDPGELREFLTARPS